MFGSARLTRRAIIEGDSMAYKSVSIATVKINGVVYNTGDIFNVTKKQGEQLVLARRAVWIADKPIKEKEPEVSKPDQADSEKTPAEETGKKIRKKVKQNADNS